MKFVIFSLLLLSSFAFSEELRSPASPDSINMKKSLETTDLKINGEVSLVSNDIFRGVSISNNKSAMQGWIGLTYLQFLNVGIYTSETHFIVPSDTSKVANRYNVYFASAYAPIYGDLVVGLQYCNYDFIEYPSLNQNEYFVEMLYKNSKLKIMHNPNYIGLNTKYQYISLEHSFNLSNNYSLTPLISTTVIEKPENVDIKNYQEFKLTLSKDLGVLKINTIYSNTNRSKFYSSDKYKDNSVAFGVVIPF